MLAVSQTAVNHFSRLSAWRTKAVAASAGVSLATASRAFGADSNLVRANCATEC